MATNMQQLQSNPVAPTKIGPRMAVGKIVGKKKRSKKVNPKEPSFEQVQKSVEHSKGR